MKTDAYSKDAKFTCDCCEKRVTRKGGRFPFYLCERCAKLPLAEIVSRRASKYGSSEDWKTQTLEDETAAIREWGHVRYDSQGRSITP